MSLHLSKPHIDGNVRTMNHPKFVASNQKDVLNSTQGVHTEHFREKSEVIVWSTYNTKRRGSFISSCSLQLQPSLKMRPIEVYVKNSFRCKVDNSRKNDTAHNLYCIT